MPLYELLGAGCHTALTATQIETLFQAGKIGRNTPCKVVAMNQWQTVDELFPLLKYDSSGWSEATALAAESRSSARILFACGLIAAALTAWIYAGLPKAATARGGHGDLPVIRSIAAVRAPAFTPSPQPLWSGYSRPQPTPIKLPSISSAEAFAKPAAPQIIRAPAVMPSAAPVSTPPTPGYYDVIVPLDRDVTVQTPDAAVSLRIHDNDVTSFDVWVNGGLRRNVTKEKGISRSRTDETLIYGSGRTSLYYVWEISGTLNHCIVRVRTE